MLNTLTFMGDKLNKANILWGVGASILLNQYGLVDKPNDIDIFVYVDHIEKANEVLEAIGIKRKWEKTTTYSTKYFYEYVINGVDVDVMAGFAINHEAGTYEYVFDNTSILQTQKINGVEIPFTSLEDWYVLYQLIPNREAKVKLIEEYLFSHRIKNKYLLERALDGNLPLQVKKRIVTLLEI